MPLPYMTQYAPGASLGISVSRLSDGLLWDFGVAQVYAASPGTPIQALTPGTGNFLGKYSYTIASTPQAQWADGFYCVNLHLMSASNLVVGLDEVTMRGGQYAGSSGASGLVLAPDGLDSIVVDGVNVRQAIAIILAHAAGNIDESVAGLSSVKAAGSPSTTRIVASTPATGRTVTSLVPPA